MRGVSKQTKKHILPAFAFLSFANCQLRTNLKTFHAASIHIFSLPVLFSFFKKPHNLFFFSFGLHVAHARSTYSALPFFVLHYLNWSLQVDLIRALDLGGDFGIFNWQFQNAGEQKRNVPLVTGAGSFENTLGEGNCFKIL